MFTWSLLILLTGADPGTSADSQSVRIPGIVLTLIDQAEVPSREAGVLLSRAVHAGQTVEAGQILARIDDTDARLRLAKAESELQHAEQVAKNDIQVRFAEKAAEVAQAEWQRAVDSATKFNKSVSQTELDRLQLLADKSRLEIDQAKIDLSLAAQLRDLKTHDRDLAALSVAHRQIKAPLTGMVIQWRLNVGEWVQPGAPVVRIIRLDRLRAEGFAPASRLRPAAVGSPIRFLINLPSRPQAEFNGELVFVSPEIDPVNGQVRFWAEIENPRLELRPGDLGVLECALQVVP